jgi:hypothetical protein
MDKLRDFGQTPKTQVTPQQVELPTPKEAKAVQPVQPPIEQEKEKLTTVNIKITRSQQDWLADTARLVRDNNDEPVPPADRVYPQHLIQVAIELLKSADVDWGQIKNVEDVRKYLSL